MVTTVLFYVDFFEARMGVIDDGKMELREILNKHTVCSLL